MTTPNTLDATSDDFEIGGPDERLYVGASFDKDYEWLAFSGEPNCKEVAIDFTGYTLVAEVLDSADVVLDAFTVTPSAGDATGKFKLQLAPSQVTTGLRDNAVAWRFRATLGATVNNILVHAPFTVT